MTDDLYGELGVARDASETEIRRGYRSRSKQTHPNAPGGSAEAFARTHTALVVLIDPRRRDRYDRQGTIEEDKPDNDRANVIGILELQLSTIMNDFSSSGDPTKNPLTIDVVEVIRGRIDAKVAEDSAATLNGEAMLAFMREVRSRWRLPVGADAATDPILRSFDAQITRVQGQLDALKDSVRLHEMASDFIAKYGFRFEQPTPEAEGFFSVRISVGWP